MSLTLPYDGYHIGIVASGNTIKMDGRHSANGAFRFKDLCKWINNFKVNNKTLRIFIDTEYINSPAEKGMLDVVNTLNELHDKGQLIQLTWIYEPDDERIEEIAGDLKNFAKFTFLVIFNKNAIRELKLRRVFKLLE